MKKLVAILLLLMTLPILSAAQTAHSVTLNWADARNPANTTYNVYRFVGPCANTPFTSFTKLVTGLTVKNYTDGTVNPGNNCFYVTAFNVKESDPSNTALAPVPASAPTGLDVTYTFNGNTVTANIVWADGQAGATFNVFRAPGLCSGNPVFAKIASGLTVKNYADSTVIPGNYCFALTSTINGIESPQSSTIMAAVPSFSPQTLTLTVQ